MRAEQIDQAAELFDLFLAKLEQRRDGGVIPFIQRQGQRYVSVRAMITFDQADQAERQRWLGALLEASQELGAYDRPPSARRSAGDPAGSATATRGPG